MQKSSFNVLLWHIHQRTQNGCEFSFSFGTIHIVNSKYAQAIGWGGRFLLGFLVPVSYFFFSACNVNALIWAHLTLLFTHRASSSSCKRCATSFGVSIYIPPSPCAKHKKFLFSFSYSPYSSSHFVCVCVCSSLTVVPVLSHQISFSHLSVLSLNIAC